jgi:hypothetical protein
MGNLLRSLVEGGVQIGVSSRGNGKTKQRRDGITEVTDYKLFTVDAVYAPSAPDAFVTTLIESEGLAKVFQNQLLMEEFELFLEARKTIKSASKGNRTKIAFEQFEALLKSF